MAYEIFIIFTLLIFGLIFASFANYLIYRLMTKQSLKVILTDRSRCPNCKKVIKWYDNIPIISYLLLKGRCRYCGWKIPFRYLLVEILGGLIPLVVYLKFHALGWITVISYALLGYILLVLSFIDWYTFTVPDILSIGGTVLGWILSLFRPDITPAESLLASLSGFGLIVAIIFVYYNLKGIVPLGLGDAKLLALIGAFGGFIALYYSILFGSIFAFIFFLPRIVRNRNLRFVFPFVPFLSAGAFLGIILFKGGG